MAAAGDNSGSKTARKEQQLSNRSQLLTPHFFKKQNVTFNRTQLGTDVSVASISSWTIRSAII